MSSFEARRSKSAAGSRRSKLLLGQTEVEVDDRSQGGQLAAVQIIPMQMLNFMLNVISTPVRRAIRATTASTYQHPQSLSSSAEHYNCSYPIVQLPTNAMSPQVLCTFACRISPLCTILRANMRPFASQHFGLL